MCAESSEVIIHIVCVNSLFSIVFVFQQVSGLRSSKKMGSGSVTAQIFFCQTLLATRVSLN